MSYIGVPPFGRTVRTITELTATAGQTNFMPAGGYIQGYVDVFLNGVLLASSDFTANDSTNIVLTSAAALDDEIKVIAYWPVTMIDTYSKTEVNNAFVGKISSTGAALMPVGTTAQRPVNATVGMVRFNTDLNYLEEYRQSQWQAISNIFTASGGTETIVDVDGISYKVHTFNSSGTFTVISGSAEVEYLISAGGGGGGGGFGTYAAGGGGGAGGLISGTLFMNTPNTTVIVGAGGAGSLGNGLAVSGSASSFGSLSTIGGGRGAIWATGGAASTAASGGSGGGGANASGFTTGGSGTIGQGNAGGNGVSYTGTANSSGAGGGGKDTIGSNGNAGTGGDGGLSFSSTITGVSNTYAGGGGGGGNVGGLAGNGGGNGGSIGASGGNASANRGGGGGGGGTIEPGATQGGNGGSGVVIIRYQL